MVETHKFRTHNLVTEEMYQYPENHTSQSSTQVMRTLVYCTYNVGWVNCDPQHLSSYGHPRELQKTRGADVGIFKPGKT